MNPDLIDLLKSFGPDFFLRPPFSVFVTQIACLLNEKHELNMKREQVSFQEDVLNQKVIRLRDELVEKLKTYWENYGDG
jgi:hypothetical protein